MRFGFRSVVGASLAVLAVVVPLVEACKEEPQEGMVGALGEYCFPGNTCNPGLTCLQIIFDGGVSDGGQCFCLDASDCFPDVWAPEADAPVSVNDATKNEN
jgi:hypothetical protein